MTTKQATVQGSRGRSAGIVAAATLVALVIWGLARVLGVELTVGKAAGGWPFLGSTALAISIIGPTWLADGAAGVVLIGMHLAVGLVLIAGFNRSGSR